MPTLDLAQEDAIPEEGAANLMRVSNTGTESSWSQRQRDTDRKRDEERKRLEDLDFERSVYVSVLTLKDFSAVLGSEWLKRPPTKVDLSDGRFQLETLTGPSGGLLCPQLKKHKLTFLDVSENRLHDINCISKANGFQALLCLMAKRNLLGSVTLHLPTLVELNLSHNQLTQLPPLDKIPNLEVLMVSHNQLSGTVETLQHSPRIKRLDLAYNQYDFNPSQLAKALQHMGRLRALSDLRLYNNPFVACFKEYQVFVVRALPTLTVLDDLDIESYSELMRYDIKQSGLKDLAFYDHAYKKRKEKEQNEQEDRKAGDRSAACFVFEGGVPRLKNIVALLQEVIDDVTVLQKNVQQVHGIAKRRAQHLKVLNEMGDIFWEDIVHDEFGKAKTKSLATDADYEAAVSRTLELLVLVMERHDSVRVMLIETLGWLTSVDKHAFGYKCLERLARLMMASSEDKAQVLRTLETIVVPCLKSLAHEVGLTGQRTRKLMYGVILLLDKRQHRGDVAKVLRDITPMLLDWFKKSDKGQDFQDGEHIIHALARLTEDQENLLLVASPEVARKCVAAINNKTYSLSAKFSRLWIDFLHLSENLIRYSDTDEVADIFQKDSVHVTVIARGRDILAEGGIDETPDKAKVVSRILRFLARMMKNSEQVLVDSCKSYHFTDFLCQLLKDHSDPLVIAEGCACLLVVLENPQMYKQKGKKVVEDLMKLAPFLMFLGDQRYGEIYSIAMHHNRPGKYEKLDPPVLAHLDEPLVCTAFCSVINLFAFFAFEEGPHDELREIVNTELIKMGRGQKLLRLLVVPNDEVRLSVVHCVGQVELDDIASAEMGMLVKCLSDTRNISEGETEIVLAHVMKLLERLVDSNGNEGVQFRQNYAEMSISEAYLILHQNALRDTYGREDEEDQKLVLSCAIISFLRACSRRIPLREHLRAPHIEEKFPEILKWEEELHRPYAKDVAVEQTWTGRSLDNLMHCLSGDSALHRSKKVTFRVLSRMADVSEGCPDFIEGNKEPLSLQDIAEKECGMWDEKKTARNQLHLDEQELVDLRSEATNYKSRLDAILRHLMSFETRTEEKRVLELVRAEDAWFDEAKVLGESRMATIASEKERRAAETSPELKVEAEVEVEEELSGDKVLASAIHQFEDTVDDDVDHLFTLRPDQFTRDETILVDRVKGGALSKSSTYKSEYSINMAYPISAFLRIVYAVLLVPPTEECRKQVVADFQKQEVASRLCALVESVPYLNCNVAAKFLHVMRHVLEARITLYSSPPLEILSMMAKYVQRIADGLLSLLKLTKDQCLDVREQTLCSEIGSFVTAVIASTPPSVNWFGCPITRREVISRCIDHMVPAVTIRLLIAMIIYDLQMDLGGGERARIQKQFVQQAYNKIPMKDNATQALVQLLVRSPHHKYNVLEVFSVADVFNQQSVRPCYLAELLNDVTMGTYLVYCEDYIREKSTSGKDLRILHMHRVETADPKGRAGTVQRLLCATQEFIALLAPPDKKPLYGHGDELTGRWMPTWEAVFPRPPKEVWKRSYSEIACLYKCYGSQIMAIEWKPTGTGAVADEDRGLQAARRFIANQAHPHSGKSPVKGSSAKPPEGRAGANCGIGASSDRAIAKQAADEPAPNQPSFDLLIFQRSHCREAVALMLKKLSADRVELGAKIVNDPSIRREVLEHAEVNDPTGESVLAVSVALAEPKTSMLDWGAKGTKEPLLFVLTLKKVLVFNMSLNSWWPQKLDIEEHVDMEDFRPKDLFADAPASSGVAETVIQAGQAHPKGAQKVQKTNVLTYSEHQDLPPKEVVFKTSAEAELTIRFRNNSVITIHFFDDTERESWRRALAYTLFKSPDKVWTRDIPVVA